MDILERIKNVIVKNLVEVKLGTNRPAEKSGETGDREQGEGSGRDVGKPSLKAKTKEIAMRFRQQGGKGSFRNRPGGEDKELDEAKKGRCWTGYKPTPGKKPYSKGSCMKESKSPAWQRSEGKNPEGGLNAKGRASAKAQGHNLKPPVSKEQAGKSEKSAARRKSFCARMSGHKKKNTSSKTANDPNSRINKALRKWDC